MAIEDDELNALIVSESALNRRLLGATLKGLLQIVEESGAILLTLQAQGLPKKLQIVTYLLGRKAAKALGNLDEEAIPSSELSKAVGMSPGATRGQLSFLKKDGLVDVTDHKHFVPGYAVERAAQAISAAREGS